MSDEPQQYSAPRPSEVPPETPAQSAKRDRTPKAQSSSTPRSRSKDRSQPRTPVPTRDRFPISTALAEEQARQSSVRSNPAARNWVFFTSEQGEHLTFTSAGLQPSDIEIPFAGNLPPDGLKVGDTLIDSVGSDWRVKNRLVFLTLARSRPAKQVYVLEPVVTPDDIEALNSELRQEAP